MQTDDIPPAEDYLLGSTLLVNKPKDWTSFDVVNKIRATIRHAFGIKKIKVGHSGTLDPMATGLLIICTGKHMKKLHEFQGLSKCYEGTILFGGTTPSYDAETEIDQAYPIDHLTPTLLEEALTAFRGKIEQVPPMFSAIKVDGQPLYKKARKGERVEIKARPVEITQFDLERIELPEVDFKVACSKGTYIRSLAHDLGKAVDSGAHLTRLVRTKVGEFDLDNAWNLEALVENIRESAVQVNIDGNP